MLIVTDKLNGANYREWAQAVKLAIGGRGKMRFLIRAVKMPTETNELNLMSNEEWNYAQDAATYKGKIEKERVFQFLARLNKSLDNVRSRILSRVPLPSTREVFSEVR
ncbi:hypothetical protein L6164_005533 [Bauhinia variegata]|uniref:Uncharacterized protein n=1 Tax=Bauhinia variegata TaxID=167791 RepID=A0ACB9PS21_BAUVA|nr:hypothetical protein L6164_005533 [Bauhinia variegata]